MRIVLSRLRGEKGFGLVELLMAMTLLNVGILAIIAAFNSGTLAIARASHLSTAAALADQQMERYRALGYSAIALDSSTIPGTTPYTSDTAYSASQVTSTCAGDPTTAPYAYCNASRSVVGADRHKYRVDTYIVSQQPTTTPVSRTLKLVTVVVRDGTSPTARPFAREASTFDQSTAS